MWSEKPLNGASLPAKTLCLTFDDGPGAQTLDLAQFLGEEGIPAAFFFLGENLEKAEDAARQVRTFGHLAGSHAFEHRKLTGSAMSDNTVIANVLKTDARLKRDGDGGPIFFRPPYGAWAPRLAHVLNWNPATCIGHVGPIGWDFDGMDYSFWEQGRPPESCADLYFKLLMGTRNQSGILLCHDHSADNPQASKGNRCLEMIRILTARLREQGFAFVPLTDVPSVRKTMQARVRFRLDTANGLSTLCSGVDNSFRITDVEGKTLWEELQVVPLVSNSIALRDRAGRYLAWPQNSDRPSPTFTLEASGVLQFSFLGAEKTNASQ